TVEQAARIAGIDPLTLVRTLNEHVGLETDSVAVPVGALESSQDKPEWIAAAEVAVELDVRDFQRRGEEPFGAIMEAVRRVPAGQVLALRNTFEPVPLYDVLGMRGFEHWARQDAADDWTILFYNTGRPRQAAQPGQVAPA